MTEMARREARERVTDPDTLVVDAAVPAALFETSLVNWYRMVRNGSAPVKPIMVGRRQKYRTADVRAALGIGPAGE